MVDPELCQVQVAEETLDNSTPSVVTYFSIMFQVCCFETF